MHNSGPMVTNKMTNTTDTPRWKLTEFASALLEHDGETCNEIYCASHDEAECLVDLLNKLTKRAEEAEAAVEKLREALDTAYDLARKVLNPTD
jgi:hypothetical protein